MVGCHLGNSKNCHISAAVRAISMKFDTMTQFTLLTVPIIKNLKFQKSKMATAAILKNRKIAISRPRFERIRRNFVQ